MQNIKKYFMTLALLLTAVTGAWADGDTKYTVTFKANGITKTVENVTLPKKFSCDYNNENGELDLIIQQLYELSGGYCVTEAPTSSGSENVTCGLDNSSQFITISAPFEGTATVTGKYFDSDEISFDYSLKITCAEPPIEVTTNAASEQDLFTEASFEMPTSDVAVNYMLVRDMQDKANPVAFSGLPSSGNIVVKKGSDDKYQPAEALTIQLIDPLAAEDAKNIIAADGITIKVLVGAENEQGAIDYDHDNPITLEAFLADMKPGYYWIKAESTDENSPYDGTVYSQELLLLNGYELTIPAGEYATFYHNEKLRIEDTEAELYTIANVTATEAVLSEKMEVAPAETPLLVYNAGSETKTFLLIPTDDEASQVLVAAEFRGTLAAKDMPASSSTMDYYVCTGKAFTWVRDAGQIAANRCWLQIGSGNQPANTRASSRAITRGIGGIDGTTGIDTIDNEQFANDTYYDLNGRKVTNPKRGGIYIHNGKKVIKH